MSFTDRLAAAMPKFIFATVLAVATAVGCTTFFFYALDFITDTAFFAQSPTWIAVVSVLSWLLMIASAVALHHEYRKGKGEGNLDTLASIMIDQLREEQAQAAVSK